MIFFSHTQHHHHHLERSKLIIPALQLGSIVYFRKIAKLATLGLLHILQEAPKCLVDIIVSRKFPPGLVYMERVGEILWHGWLAGRKDGLWVWVWVEEGMVVEDVGGGGVGMSS